MTKVSNHQLKAKSGLVCIKCALKKTTFYKSVKHLLKGNPNIERHWSDDKERFSSYAVSYAENNKALEDFKETYASVIKEYPELSAKQVAMYYSSDKPIVVLQTQNKTSETTERNFNLLEDFLKEVIEREKGKPGCNFELYYKLLKKCQKRLN